MGETNILYSYTLHIVIYRRVNGRLGIKKACPFRL